MVRNRKSGKRKRKLRSKRAPGMASSRSSSNPYIPVRSARISRRFEFATHVSHTWLEAMAQFGVYALKLIIRKLDIPIPPPDYNPNVGIMSIQSFDLRLDDLLATSVFSFQSEGKHRCKFAKARLRSVTFTLSSMASLSEAKGLMALVIIPLNEAEALESVHDLSHEQKYSVPRDFQAVSQLPGAKSGPVARPLSTSFRPRGSSWVRDFVRIGQSSASSAENGGWGLPFARVIIAYNDLNTSKYDAQSVYGPSSMLTLSTTAILDFAEEGDRLLDPQLKVTEDAEKVELIYPTRTEIVPLSSLKSLASGIGSDDGFVVVPSSMAQSPTSAVAGALERAAL